MISFESANSKQVYSDTLWRRPPAPSQTDRNPPLAAHFPGGRYKALFGTMTSPYYKISVDTALKPLVCVMDVNSEPDAAGVEHIRHYRVEKHRSAYVGSEGRGGFQVVFFLVIGAFFVSF